MSDIGTRKRALRLALYQLWSQLSECSPRQDWDKAARKWVSYQWIVGLEAKMPGEALAHLNEVRSSPEYVAYEAARAAHRAAMARSRAKRWYSRTGKAKRADDREDLNRSRRQRWASLTSEQRKKINTQRRPRRNQEA